MIIVYLSNFFNHHQSQLSDVLYNSTDVNYYFVETQALPEVNKALGYPLLKRPYLVNYYSNNEFVDRLVIDADVVIHGEAPLSLIKKRLRLGKLTFHDNERRYKSWVKYLKWPIYTFNSFFLNKGYMLCASAYASRDFGLSGLRPDRCFKWGYFTKVKEIDSSAIQQDKFTIQNKARIMWCSRFIKLKHPELAVELALKLKIKGYPFLLDMYGNGDQQEKIISMINKYDLSAIVRLHGARPNEVILDEMRKHDIFLFTSDQNEGWGAVLNEAMASGCAVVASHDIGAVPYLIKDGINGLIYKSRDINSLYEKVVELIENPSKCYNIRREALNTMQRVWNADVAGKNLIRLSESLLKGFQPDIIEGPCSPAPRFNHKWM